MNIIKDMNEYAISTFVQYFRVTGSVLFCVNKKFGLYINLLKPTGNVTHHKV